MNPCRNPQYGGLPFCDMNRPIEGASQTRSRMTTEEKISNLGSGAGPSLA